MSEPKKSAGLIIIRQARNVEANDYYDYEVLYMKRSESLPFGDSYAFPFGTVQKEDFNILKKKSSDFALSMNENHDLKYHLFKTAALRETYNDTGLLFLSKNFNNKEFSKKFLKLKSEYSSQKPTF
mmetsp:Transcript_37113/g.33380  ORF Transcript_37113/g.33380 Transcript_37113/m.33380 type:complete len:126 (+) Transcript_37113:73-450(+)